MQNLKKDKKYFFSFFLHVGVKICCIIKFIRVPLKLEESNDCRNCIMTWSTSTVCCQILDALARTDYAFFVLWPGLVKINLPHCLNMIIGKLLLYCVGRPLKKSSWNQNLGIWLQHLILAKTISWEGFVSPFVSTGKRILVCFCEPWSAHHQHKQE